MGKEKLVVSVMERVKQFSKTFVPRDFSFNVFSFFLLGLFLTAGFLLQRLAFPASNLSEAFIILASVLCAGLFLVIKPFWFLVVIFTISAWLGIETWRPGEYWILVIASVLGLLVSPLVQVVYQWDKVVVLRLGKFRKLHGPGVFLLFPLLDRVAAFIDTRIRATDFRAENTITHDTVPVNVDAICFWLVWDAQKAVLEVENYFEAVILSAQTALRDSIGKHELSDLLSDRDKIGQEIQRILDTKMNGWGITILSVEITDVIIPEGLEDAMSKRAQAEREGQSRIILGNAEIEVARKFAEAAEIYKDKPAALNLRAMNMVYEGMRQNGSMILVPSGALESMNLGAVMGTAALRKQAGSNKEDRNDQG